MVNAGTSALLAAACAASANAFVAPSAFNGAALTTSAKPSSSAIKMGFENEIGVQAPLGFWDPLGILEGQDQEFFDNWRYMEVKHGRVAMLAVLGHITQQNVRFPGLLSSSENLAFSDMPNGLAAIGKIPPNGLAQIFLFIFVLEVAYMKNTEGSFPGDMTNGINPFAKAWEKMTPEQQNKKRAIELNNGRAAQMGIWGLVTHEMINGHPYVINDLLGMSYSFN